MLLSIEQIMSEQQFATLRVSDMTDGQKETLMEWAMRMYDMGKHVVEDIEAVKFGGRLVVLDDGSRREVEDFDASTSEMRDFLDKVVVIDDEMYKLDESEKVMVTQDFD